MCVHLKTDNKLTSMTMLMTISRSMVQSVSVTVSAILNTVCAVFFLLFLDSFIL